ncbi:toll/interleukin-1 receptor domain-containing protein [Coleofasciculus sp. FACHB-1120]|nr:toll/interleukin-1 receptor domain-containing protein [Coleofasciculus sp. FACHB-1120]
MFFSYAHEDEKQLVQLEKQLRLLERQGVITTWHNRKIGAGKESKNERDAHLNTASVILLLVSVNFINSVDCWNVEVPRAMQRHEAKEARVIPIILDFVDWKSAPFGKLKHLPNGDKPIKGRNREQAFWSVAKGIREAVEELAENR